MKYISTRGGVQPVEFTEAVMMGLADDGGLLIPESIPDVRGRLDAWRPLAYPQLALEVLGLFATDIPPDDLRALIERTYTPQAFVGGVAPLAAVGEVSILELWHGPTLSFKDIALQLLGNLFEYILARQGALRPVRQAHDRQAQGNARLNILGATSGDTGSAAICGVRSRTGIDIFMLHPAGRVSPIQRRQMTTVLDDNVHNIAIEGSFDDCQRIMKSLAANLDFKRTHCLGAVNSVNWARVLAQIVYYFSAAFEVQNRTGAPSVRFCVPTGNFGDVLAGWYAMQMGAPIERLILATNENDILARFFNTGEYSRGAVAHTLSPAMDIQVASNFERYLYYRLGCDNEKLRALMHQFSETGSLAIAPTGDGTSDSAFLAGVGTTQAVLATIKKYHEQYDYLLDPHTAVGVSVAESTAPADAPIVCLATAHPAKFPDAIKQATGKDLAHHEAIDALTDLPERCKTLPCDAQLVGDLISQTVGRT